MFRINRQKWLEAVKAVEARREANPQLKKDAAAGLVTWKEFRERGGQYCDEAFQVELTKLYSIRSAANDRVHRVRARLTFSEAYDLGLQNLDVLKFQDAGGTLVFDLTLEQQQKYIGDSYKAYEREEELPTASTTVTEMVQAGARR